MIWIMKMCLIILLIQMMNSFNPMKTCMILLMLSILIFTMMSENLGSSWMSFIMVMLFLGGILILMMILSSMMPNEKYNKNKIINLMVTATILIQISNLNNMSLIPMTHLKSVLNSLSDFKLILLMMMGYFFSFLSILSKENMSMRSTMCCSESIL